MSHYNVVTGANAGTINALIDQLYHDVYPKLFQGSVPLKLWIIDGALDYDIKQPPVLNFDSALAKDFLSNQVHNHQSADAVLVDSSLAYINDDLVTLDIDLPETELVLAIEGGRILHFTFELKVALQVNISSSGSVHLKVLTTHISEDHDHLLYKIIQYFMPHLIKKANEILAKKSFPIPPLHFKTKDGIELDFDIPILSETDNTILAFTALKDTGGVVPPSSIGVSHDQISASFDADLTGILVNQALHGLQKHGHISFGIHIFSIDAEYHVGVKDAQLSFEHDGSVQANLTAYGGGSIKVKNFIHDITLGFTIGATPTATGEIRIDGDKVNLEIESLNDFHIDIHVNGVPGWLSDIIGDIISRLLDPIRALISDILNGLTIQIAKIPVIPVKVAGENLQVELDDLHLDTLTDSDGKVLMSVSMTPKLEQASEV